MIVQLSQTAFLSSVLSSIEAYKKECYGLLLGYRTDTEWLVEYAIPYQTATRGHKMVCPHGGRDRRVRACLGELASYQVLGTFHSHPAWGKLRAVARPSKTDIASMPPGELDLIIAVNDSRVSRRFRYAERGRLLKGTVCDYSLTLAAFYNSPYSEFTGEPCVRRTLIRCPYAIGFEPEGSRK
ncbi:MAG TPA: Mov34/MPN/PAD-1 family protein [Abditibacteriaceae bacterium]|jgi:proteasome lid subunit RPN8/RPN11